MKGICTKCGNPVTNAQTAAYKVEGFEKERNAGGQNHVLRKKRVDGFIWHEHCYDSMARELDGTGEQMALT